MLLRLDPPKTPLIWQRVKTLTRRSLSMGLYGCWLVSFGGLLVFVLWMILDPHFADAAAWVEHDLKLEIRYGEVELPEAARESVGQRPFWMVGLAIAWIIANSSLVIGLVSGPLHHRRLLSWMSLMTVACVAIAVALGWSDLLWFGRTVRISQHISSLEPTAQQLRKNWPRVDGDLPELGPFSAYPYGKATLLLRLTQPEVDSTDLAYQSVERSSSGGLRFQLGGAERGAWLEWHPEAEHPDSFQGGLEAKYRLIRASHLRDGWYLAKYESVRYGRE